MAEEDLFVAMLVGREETPVKWQLANEPRAVRRLERRLERETTGPMRVFYEDAPVRYALQRQVRTSRVSSKVDCTGADSA